MNIANAVSLGTAEIYSVTDAGAPGTKYFTSAQSPAWRDHADAMPAGQREAARQPGLWALELGIVGDVYHTRPWTFAGHPEAEELIRRAEAVAVGFARKEYVSSLIAGIVTLYETPNRPGDWVDIGGTYGEVRSIGMRAMKLVTPVDSVVVVPHRKLWDHLISNGKDGSQNLLCVANFYLHPQHDATLVKRTLYGLALTSPMVQLQRPIVVVAQEQPWCTHYRLKAYPIDPRDQFRFDTDVTVRGKAALTAAYRRYRRPITKLKGYHPRWVP